MKVVFDHSSDEAKNIKTFWFKPDRHVRYVAGQFTELRLPHNNKDKRGDKRWFTLSSSPTENMLSITTKFAGEKSSSFKRQLLSLEPGTELNLAEPMGDFVLPKNQDIPLVFVAGGIGVTPMRSMAKFLADSKEKRSIHLIYAANTIEDVAFRDLFERTCSKFDIVLTEPPAKWQGEVGRLSASRIVNIAGGSKDKRIYLSGPEPMVEALDKGLKDSGFNKRDIVTDFFPGYTDL